MTCIVGIETDRGVIIGGDSAGVAGWGLTVRADLKTFERDEFVFGFTTSFRMGQLLRYGTLDPDTRKGREDPERFMCTTFIDAVRQCLKQGGWASESDGNEIGGTFLVGFAGQLYSVYSDYQVGRAADGYAACGCGEDLALGAMHASRGDPTRRVTAALEAAAHHSAGVSGPFHLVTGAA